MLSFKLGRYNKMLLLFLILIGFIFFCWKLLEERLTIFDKTSKRKRIVKIWVKLMFKSLLIAEVDVLRIISSSIILKEITILFVENGPRFPEMTLTSLVCCIQFWSITNQFLWLRKIFSFIYLFLSFPGNIPVKFCVLELKYSAFIPAQALSKLIWSPHSGLWRDIHLSHLAGGKLGFYKIINQLYK